MKEFWLSDPEAKQIQVYQLNPPTNNTKTPILHGNDASLNTPLLPGLLISSKAVFRPSRLG